MRTNTITKRTIWIATIALLVAALSLMSLAGCSGESESPAPGSQSAAPSSEPAPSEQEAMDIGLIISSPAANDSVTLNNRYVMPAGATVADLLYAADVDYTTETTSEGPVISAIEGLSGAPGMGWAFTLNGEGIQSNPLDTVLENGDTVEWSYIDLA